MFAVKGSEGLFEYLGTWGNNPVRVRRGFQRIDDHGECSLAAVGVNFSLAPWSGTTRRIRGGSLTFC